MKVPQPSQPSPLQNAMTKLNSINTVPAYQPEGALDIFNRALSNYDIATGRVPISPDYSSTGSADTLYQKDPVPPYPEPTCYILSAGNTCTDDQLAAVEKGVAIIKDYIVVGVNETGYDSSSPARTVKRPTTRKRRHWVKMDEEPEFDDLE